VKLLAGPVAALAMNGAVVTYAVRATSPNQCAKVLVWDVAGGGGAVVSGHETCHAFETSTGGGIVAVASAGKRSAWMVALGGNTEFSDALYTSSVASPRERRVAVAGGSAAGGTPWSGAFISDLQGRGDLILSRSGRLLQGRTVREALRLVTPGSFSAPFAGPAPIDDVSLDAGRIAVLRGTNVTLYSAVGRRLGGVALGGAEPVLRVLLTGDRLVVRRAEDLAVYDIRSHRRLRTFATTGSPQSLGADGNIAAFRRLDEIFVVNLSTGRTKLLTTAHVRDVAEPRVVIGSAGVVYAAGNRITYYPRSSVEAILRR
jgi:hypothetical protein